MALLQTAVKHQGLLVSFNELAWKQSVAVLS